MQNIELGIIGCGNHSHEHFKAVQEIEGVSITSCCDIDIKKAKDCSELYQCNTFYKSLDDLLKNEKPDGIIICTWPVQHLEQIEKCLSSGIKNILCEKSLSLSAKDALSIWKLVNKHDSFLMEACKNRHHPATLKLDKILSYKDIGAIDSIKATFSNYEPESMLKPNDELDWRWDKDCGGGVAHDWMSYLVDACNHFSNSKPLRVYATGNINMKYEVIDRIFGMIEYQNGIVGIIESSKESNFNLDLQIACANGILKLPCAWAIFGEVEITQTHRKKDWDFVLKDTYQIEECNAFINQLKNFAQAIRKKEEPLLPLKSSIINVLTIDALEKSLHKKKPVEIDITSDLL